ncbi:hypothetical protein NPIL_269721 [Nephila pilipes]|uniref:Transmembrane protein n=1 Tax=Nephila pilipes TaxID=299642 RepID=A0A8X6Q8T3_NEPPI|nr:hypothetical protein NPIL_269721 [Nephila pilipes]
MQESTPFSFLFLDDSFAFQLFTSQHLTHSGVRFYLALSSPTAFFPTALPLLLLFPMTGREHKDRKRRRGKLNLPPLLTLCWRPTLFSPPSFCFFSPPLLPRRTDRQTDKQKSHALFNTKREGGGPSFRNEIKEKGCEGD